MSMSVYSYKIVQIAPQADTVESENYVEKCHDPSDVFIRQERSYLGLHYMRVGLATNGFYFLFAFSCSKSHE